MAPSYPRNCRLLSVLEPVTTHPWDLARAGYEANWFCYVASHVTEHAAELDRPTMQRLLSLPATCGSTCAATASTKKKSAERGQPDSRV